MSIITTGYPRGASLTASYITRDFNKRTIGPAEPHTLPAFFTAVSIPDGGAWGGDRRNLSRAGKTELLATAKRLTAEGRN